MSLCSAFQSKEIDSAICGKRLNSCSFCTPARNECLLQGPWAKRGKDELSRRLHRSCAERGPQAILGSRGECYMETLYSEHTCTIMLLTACPTILQISRRPVTNLQVIKKYASGFVWIFRIERWGSLQHFTASPIGTLRPHPALMMVLSWQWHGQH